MAEIAALAPIAVSAAAALVEKVLPSLVGQASARSNVEDLQVCLRTLEAYLADRDGNEGSAQLRERKKQIRDVATEIEDVLEEFMFYVPHRIHRYKISHQYDQVAYAVKLRTSLHELWSKIPDIKRKINNIVTLDQAGLISGSSSSRKY